MDVKELAEVLELDPSRVQNGAAVLGAAAARLRKEFGRIQDEDLRNMAVLEVVREKEFAAGLGAKGVRWW